MTGAWLPVICAYLSALEQSLVHKGLCKEQLTDVPCAAAETTLPGAVLTSSAVQVNLQARSGVPGGKPSTLVASWNSCSRNEILICEC